MFSTNTLTGAGLIVMLASLMFPVCDDFSLNYHNSNEIG